MSLECFPTNLVKINKCCKPYSSHQKGFSLIEVMVTLVIASIGLMSLTVMHTRSVNNTSFAYTEIQSSFHLQEIVELLRANKDAATNGEFNINLTSFSSLTVSPDISKTHRYNWFNNLNNTLPSSMASINCDINSRCVLTVEYNFLGVLQKQSLAVIL